MLFKSPEHSLEINQYSLLQSDRDTLKAAAGRLSSFAATGAGAGLALGLLLAFRVRSTRTKTFQAFRAMERPTHVQFAGGRTGKHITTQRSDDLG